MSVTPPPALAAADASRRPRAEEFRREAERQLRAVERLSPAALALERQANDLDEILGRAPQLRLDVPAAGLSGQRLREAAVEILTRVRGLNVPIHYREWYELLESEGMIVAGRDPLATFLTQVTRSPVVERAEGRAGVYLLNPGEAGREAMDDVQSAQVAVRNARDRRDLVRQDDDDEAIHLAETSLVEAER